jgi:hypothetical protein
VILTRLLAHGKDKRPVTTEQEFKVEWEIAKEGPVPDGVPMFWLEVDERLKASNPNLTNQRKPLAGTLPLKVPFTLTKPAQSGDAAVTLHGVFRGQRLAPRTIVQLYQSPDIIVHRFPPPEHAGLAIRMKEFPYGAISIVLDCSYSMAYQYPSHPQQNVEGSRDKKTRRIDYALKALEKVLEAIPKDTYVSVIALVQEPRGKTTSIKMMREPDRWDKDRDLPGLMGRLLAIDPNGNSPIARAMVQARDDGFPLRSVYNGPKVILTFSDGDDTATLTGNDNYNPRIAKFLREQFTGPEAKGIEVNVICFNDAGNKDAAQEAANAREQFKVVESFDPPGHFIPQAKGGAELARALEEAIRPRLRLYEGNRRAPGFPDKGVLVSPPEGNLQGWRIAPGTYEATVQHQLKQQISVRPGELLQITLRGGTQKSFERYLFGKENAQATTRQGNWHVSVLQNRIFQKTSQLRQLVTFEDLDVAPGAGGILQHQPPGFVWLELAAKGKDTAGPLVWHNEFLYPAPAYRLRRFDWAKDEEGGWAASELRAWSLPQSAPSDDRFAHSPQDVVLGKPVAVGKAEAAIRDISVEKRAVAISPDQSEVRACLVVRLSHPGDRPFWVQAVGLNHVGEEHHFYTRSGEYTAIFWGVSNPEQARYRLNLISLHDLKSTIVPARLTLDRPSAVDDGPERLILQGGN